MLTPAPLEIYSRIRARLERLYGDRAPRQMDRLMALLGRHRLETRGAPARELWDESDTVLITYGDTLRRDGEHSLKTLARFATDYLVEAVGVVHVLPFFPYSSDDGFSVIEYRAVRPELGTWSDLRALNRNFDLMFDLVLNHCSRRSSWFADYSRGISPGREFFIEVPPDADLSAVVRPRSLPLLSPATTPYGERRVWTTFSPDQVDLDFANPDVLFEFLDILLHYVQNGMRIVRLDAIAYLWKTIGTSCIHLPETHEIVKLFRDVLAMVAPGVILLTETNVPHPENVAYFGDGDEAHLVYQFSLPPLLLHALHAGSGRFLTAWAADLAAPPRGCSFLNFTASHDGIGLRPLEGLVPAPERMALAERVRERGGSVSMRRHGDRGAETPYELNITYFDALTGSPGEDPALHRQRFLCSQTVPLSLQGIPAVYLHSLTATRNDTARVERTRLPRAINRGQWEDETLRARLADPASPEHAVFTEYTRRLRIRRRQPAFHPDAAQEVLRLGDALFAVLRYRPASGPSLIALHNLTPQPQSVAFADLPLGGDCRDLLGQGRFLDDAILLPPYACAWLETEPL